MLTVLAKGMEGLLEQDADSHFGRNWVKLAQQFVL